MDAQVTPARGVRPFGPTARCVYADPLSAHPAHENAEALEPYRLRRCQHAR